MRELNLESFEYFQFGNITSGSDGNFNFKVFPSKEDMTVKIWYGPYCLDKSQLHCQETFPLTEEGYEQMCRWVIGEQEKYYKR